MHNSSKRDLADGNLEISTMTSEQKSALLRSYDVIFATWSGGAVLIKGQKKMRTIIASGVSERSSIAFIPCVDAGRKLRSCDRPLARMTSCIDCPDRSATVQGEVWVNNVFRSIPWGPERRPLPSIRRNQNADRRIARRSSPIDVRRLWRRLTVSLLKWNMTWTGRPSSTGLHSATLCSVLRSAAQTEQRRKMMPGLNNVDRGRCKLDYNEQNRPARLQNQFASI